MRVCPNQDARRGNEDMSRWDSWAEGGTWTFRGQAYRVARFVVRGIRDHSTSLISYTSLFSYTSKCLSTPNANSHLNEQINQQARDRNNNNYAQSHVWAHGPCSGGLEDGEEEEAEDYETAEVKEEETEEKDEEEEVDDDDD